MFECRRGVAMWVGLNYFPKTSFCVCDVNERRKLLSGRDLERAKKEAN
jgi:hypothetical protein